MQAKCCNEKTAVESCLVFLQGIVLTYSWIFGYFLGYEGAPTFPVDFAKYVHDLLDNSHTKERGSSTPIVLS